MTAVWLIRHGQSKANAGLITSDVTTVGLTTKGILQAQCVAATFTQAPDLIVTSAYQRTKQTAYPLQRRFPYVVEEEWPVHEFTYLARQRCANTTKDERRPLKEAFWERCDPDYCDGEGAESFINLIRRIQQTLELIQAQEYHFIALFSHGTFIRTLIWFVLTHPYSIDFHTMRQCRNFVTAFRMPNASMIRIQIDKRQEMWFSSVVTSHLPSELLS